MNALGWFHVANHDDDVRPFVHVGAVAKRKVEEIGALRTTLPENTDPVAVDRLAMREIEDGCADKDEAKP